MDTVLILIPIVCTLAICAVIALMVVVSAHSKKQRAQIHAEVQNRLIDKFGSAPEFIAFLSSPAGREFMGAVEAKPGKVAQDRILRGIRSATVLSFLGGAFCLLGIMNSGWLIPGLIALGLGGGYVVSAILMLRLSRTWGLLGDQAPSSQTYDS